MAENLNKIWAKLEPVSHYFKELLELVEYDSSYFEDVQKRLFPQDDLETKRDTLSNIVLMLNDSNRKTAQRKAALSLLRNRLVAEEIVLLGRLTNRDNPSKIIRISSDFWIDAEIFPDSDRAEIRDIQLDELRIEVLIQNAPPVDTPKLENPSNTTQTFSKVPSPALLRSKAIEACFKSGLIDFDGTNLKIRVAVYREWITKTYPASDLTQRGFSLGSFEADETKFKKSRQLAAPRK